MLWPGIKKLGKELQFRRTDSEIVGIVENCFVKMYDGKNMKILELYVPELDDLDKENVINKLQLNKIKNYTWVTGGIKIVFPEYFRPYSIKKIMSILNETVSYFSKKYPNSSPRCHKCNTQKKSDVYCIGTESMYLCDDCLRECENNMHETSFAYHQIPTNYFSGFIGALLFSIPGVILTIILFVFLNTLGAISSLLYVVLGIKGYKKFKGKITPFGAFIIIGIGLIMTGIGVITAYSIFILREIFKEINTVDFGMLIEIFKLPEIQKELTQNLALAYLVSGIFFILQFFQMKKDWNYKFDIQKPREI
jgi:ferredoxin